MANVKAAMEYAQTFECEAMEKRLSESDLEAPTLIDVVVRHEQQIKDIAEHLLELRKWGSPMMEFKQEKPTKIVGPNLVEVLNAAGFYQKKEWVGLTGPEVDEAYRSVSDEEWAIGGLTDARVFFCAIEAKLKEKNGG